MNKHLHRVVFNAARGLRMVVQETAKSTGRGARKATSGGAGAGSAAVSVAAIAAALMSAPLHAQIVADPGAPGGQRPTVLVAPNGVPLVNIQTPSAAGVSRNAYSQFDVQRNGAINAGALDNDAGRITAVGDLRVTALGAASNRAGTLAANRNATLDVASFDNGSGSVDAVGGDLAVTTAGATVNQGGKLQASGAVLLANGGLDNTDGQVIGGRVAIDTQDNALTNVRGTLAGTATTVDIQSGALNNTAGLIQSRAALTIDTHGQALTNVDAADYADGEGGITSAGAMTLHTGAVDNSAGFVGAAGALTASSGEFINRNGGLVVSQTAIRTSYQELSNTQNIALAKCAQTGNCVTLRDEVTNGTQTMLDLAGAGKLPIGVAPGNDLGQYAGQRLANDPAYRDRVNQSIAVLDNCKANPSQCNEQAVRAAALVVLPLVGLAGVPATVASTFIGGGIGATANVGGQLYGMHASGKPVSLGEVNPTDVSVAFLTGAWTYGATFLPSLFINTAGAAVTSGLNNSNLSGGGASIAGAALGTAIGYPIGAAVQSQLNGVFNHWSQPLWQDMGYAIVKPVTPSATPAVFGTIVGSGGQEAGGAVVNNRTSGSISSPKRNEK